MAPKKATGAAAATKAKKPASGESQSTRGELFSLAAAHCRPRIFTCDLVLTVR